MHYIYIIQNNINHKLYIGKSKHPKRRWSFHKREALKKQPALVINIAMKKYGSGNFIFQIIEELKEGVDANEAEEFWIQYFRSMDRAIGYNISLGGNCAPRTEAWKKLMSEKFKGKIFHDKSPFVKGHKIKSFNHPKGLTPWNKGKKRPEMVGPKNFFYGKKFTGENHPRAKLNQEIANQIRKEFHETEMKYGMIKKLSLKYGIGETSVSDVIHDRRWLNDS